MRDRVSSQEIVHPASFEEKKPNPVTEKNDADIHTNNAAIANWIIQTCMQIVLFKDIQNRLGADDDSYQTLGIAAGAAATMGLFVAYIHRMHHQVNQKVNLDFIPEEELKKTRLSTSTKIGLALHALGDIFSGAGVGASFFMTLKTSPNYVKLGEVLGAVLGLGITIPETRAFINIARRVEHYNASQPKSQSYIHQIKSWWNKPKTSIAPLKEPLVEITVESQTPRRGINLS